MKTGYNIVLFEFVTLRSVVSGASKLSNKVRASIWLRFLWRNAIVCNAVREFVEKIRRRNFSIQNSIQSLIQFMTCYLIVFVGFVVEDESCSLLGVTVEIVSSA